MKTNNSAVSDQLARWFFSFAFVVQLYYFVNSAMLSSLLRPVLVYPSTDITYWFLLHYRIPQTLTQTPFLPATFDVLLFFVIAAAHFLTESRRWWAFCYTILIALYMITFGIYSGHHFHGLVMLLLGSIPFWFSGSKQFPLIAEGARYYFLFIFSSAFAWKFLRGGLFQPQQMVNILKAQHASFLYTDASTWHASFLRYFIIHPEAAQALLIAAALLQACFWVGFFTKKWDSALFYLAILFCALNLLVMRIPSFEILAGLIFLRLEAFQKPKGELPVSFFPRWMR